MGVRGGKARFQSELTIDASTFNNTWLEVGALVDNPVIIWFINDTNVTVQISDDAGVRTGVTLTAGRPMVLDLRDKAGGEDNYTWRNGTMFSVNASAGTGSLRIGYTIAE